MKVTNVSNETNGERESGSVQRMIRRLSRFITPESEDFSLGFHQVRTKFDVLVDESFAFQVRVCGQFQKLPLYFLILYYKTKGLFLWVVFYFFRARRFAREKFFGREDGVEHFLSDKFFVHNDIYDTEPQTPNETSSATRGAPTEKLK